MNVKRLISGLCFVVGLALMLWVSSVQAVVVEYGVVFGVEHRPTANAMDQFPHVIDNVPYLACDGFADNLQATWRDKEAEGRQTLGMDDEDLKSHAYCVKKRINVPDQVEVHAVCHISHDGTMTMAEMLATCQPS